MNARSHADRRLRAHALLALTLSGAAVGCGGPTSDPAASSSVPQVTSSAAATASSVPSSSGSSSATPAGVEDLGRAFVELLASKKFEPATSTFDATMKSGLPPELLQKTWEGLEASAGPFERIAGVRSEAAGAYRIVLVTCQFRGGARLDAKLAYDAGGSIAGLFFIPTTEPYALPSYADPKSFTERDVTVGTGEWALPGTLTIPQGTGPFRAVVLVHGSGPNDRDETGGANKPFKDLASGLASKGVAVLRYDKRTKVHGAKFPPEATVVEETITDAVLALELLAKEDRIDAKHLAVVGHSLGGHLAPRIAAETKLAAGIALLAGNIRSLPDAMVEQVKYIADLDGRRSPEEAAQIEQLEKDVAKAKEVSKRGSTSKDVVLGVSAVYWRDLAAYDPVATAKKLGRPIFVAQGERDYQVTMKDFEAWKKGLAGDPRVTLRTYPSANHLFGAGEGPSAPEEYQRRAEVVPALVDDLASWIGSLP